MCRGRPQGPEGHQLVALVAALQPASALAPLAKVSVSSLLCLALCGPGQGAGAGPLACLFGAASRVTSPLLSGEPRLHLRRQLRSILVALDGHCLKRGWSRLAWGPEKLVRVTVKWGRWLHWTGEIYGGVLCPPRGGGCRHLAPGSPTNRSL